MLPVYVFLTLKVTVALTHMNHQAPRFHHQNPLYCSTKEKESSTSRMALGWVNLHFCVNYPFSQCVCVRHNSFIGLKAAGFLLFDWQSGPRSKGWFTLRLNHSFTFTNHLHIRLTVHLALTSEEKCQCTLCNPEI